MDWIISIDPGSKSAWSLWRKNLNKFELIEYGRAKDYDVVKCFDLFSLFKLTKLIDFSKCKIFVEGQWFRLPIIRGGSKEYPSANFARVAKIIESRCAWVDAAKIIGADTEVVDPGKWIPAMTKGAPGKNADARIKYCADIYYPGINKIADENAAILLGIYCVKKIGFGIKGV